mmetsp:Transcript_8198/g.30801  ORF Transcript_8198/g.30801 Transcript_8198/m.30801 type:complete len:331 (-) Transcript_8198:27-1019(-)
MSCFLPSMTAAGSSCAVVLSRSMAACSTLSAWRSTWRISALSMLRPTTPAPSASCTAAVYSSQESRALMASFAVSRKLASVVSSSPFEPSFSSSSPLIRVRPARSQRQPESFPRAFLASFAPALEMTTEKPLRTRSCRAGPARAPRCSLATVWKLATRHIVAGPVAPVGGADEMAVMASMTLVPRGSREPCSSASAFMASMALLRAAANMPAALGGWKASVYCCTAAIATASSELPADVSSSRTRAAMSGAGVAPAMSYCSLRLLRRMRHRRIRLQRPLWPFRYGKESLWPRALPSPGASKASAAFPQLPPSSGSPWQVLRGGLSRRSSR